MSPPPRLSCSFSPLIGCRRRSVLEGTSGNERDGPQLSQIQALLAISHKYEVKRLQLWCEAKLSEIIDTSQVCGHPLPSAPLAGEAAREGMFLLRQSRADQVLTQPAYVELIKKWPQTGVKVSLFSAGVSYTELLRMVDGLEKPQERSQQATE